MRFFNISLILAYVFCGYVQVTKYQYSNSLKDKVFKTAKNSNPVRTIYITSSLPKHLLIVNQNVFQDSFQEENFRFSNKNRSEAFFCVASDLKIIRQSLFLLFNKAPPLA